MTVTSEIAQGLRVKAGVVGWCRVTKNGQITLPKEIRDRLRLRSGDFVHFLITENNNIVVRKFVLSESVDI